MNEPLDRNGLLDQFAAVITALISSIGEITGIENAKAQAAADGHHERIDESIRNEQACILKLRGQEQKRLHLAESLGWKGLTFSQVLEQADETETAVLNPLFSELNDRIAALQNARDVSDRIINTRLRELDILLARHTGRTYDRDGSEAEAFIPSPHMHDQFV